MRGLKIFFLVTFVVSIGGCYVGDDATEQQEKHARSGIAVYLPEDTPPAADIGVDEQAVHFVRYLVVNNNTYDVIITGPELLRQGLGLPSDFEGVWIKFQGKKKGSSKRLVGSTTNIVDFSDLTFTVPASTSRYIDVFADMDAGENSENRFCINSTIQATTTSFPFSPVAVSMRIPLCGNFMTTVP